MPNENKRLNFTLKVWDAISQTYRPVYIAPDATNAVQGDVKLSDATNSTANAASGMTAATPAAVRAVQINANNKLDKVTGADQTVASKVTFNNAVIGSAGITVPSGKFFTGNLNGNATTATTLRTPRTISLTGRVTGSASFNGGANASIATTIAAGSITATDIADGTITSAEIKDGAITSTDVGFNYAGSSSKGGAATAVAAGVVGTNALANNAVTSAKIADGTITAGDVGFNYAGSSRKGGAADSATKLNSLELTNQNLNDYTDSTLFYFGAGGNTCLNKPSGVVHFGMLVFRNAAGGVAQLLYGSDTVLYSRYHLNDSWSSWKMVGEIPNGSITTAKLADNAVTTAKISTGAVTSAKIADKTIVAGDIADATITGAKLVSSTITGSKIAVSTITATNIANSTITNAKMAANSINSSNIVDGTVTGLDLAANTVTLNNLASDVGTIAVQSSRPTDSNVRLWIQV